MDLIKLQVRIGVDHHSSRIPGLVRLSHTLPGLVQHGLGLLKLQAKTGTHSTMLQVLTGLTWLHYLSGFHLHLLLGARTQLTGVDLQVIGMLLPNLLDLQIGPLPCRVQHTV